MPPGLAAEIDRYGNIVDRLHRATRASSARASVGTVDADPDAGDRRAPARRSPRRWPACCSACPTSSIIRESEDLGAGSSTPSGNVLAESDSTPMFMGAMPKIVKNVIKLLGDDIHEGDVILHNDPYVGATHSPDVAIVHPDLLRRRDWSGSPGASAHLLDIGGAFPGLAIDLVDNWSEGNIYRAVKLSEKGVWQERPVASTSWRTSRTPTHNDGDIQAMIAACELR